MSSRSSESDPFSFSSFFPPTSRQIVGSHIDGSSLHAAEAPKGLPDFFVVGPPRTGTTWIHRVMHGHANLPRGVKETRFFDLRYAKGLAWYQAHFAPIVEGLPTGEVAPTYFYSTVVRRRIASLIPRTKIICTLREPVARLYSHYRIRCASGAIRCSFRDALETDPELIESTRYWFHLNGWIDSFGKDRVLALTYDHLVRDPQNYIGEICRFIGTEPFELDNSMREPRNPSDQYRSPTLGRLTYLAVKIGAALHTNRYDRTLAIVRKARLNRFFLRSTLFSPPPLDLDFAEELRRRMRSEIESVETLLNIDLSMWKRKKPEAANQ